MRFSIYNTAGRRWNLECENKTAAEQYASKVSSGNRYCIHELPLKRKTIVNAKDECVIAAIYEGNRVEIKKEYRRVSDSKIEIIDHEILCEDGSYRTERRIVECSPDQHLGDAWRENYTINAMAI